MSTLPLSIGFISIFVSSSPILLILYLTLCFNLRQHVSLKIRENPIAAYIYRLQDRFIASDG